MSGQNGQEKLSSARYRCGLYEIASAMFADAPSADALKQIADVASSAAGTVCERASERKLLGGLASYAGSDFDELRVRVASEYAELFVGPRPPLAPYYESVYLGYPNRLFTEQTEQVRKFYAQHGFETENGRKVPDDGLYFELSFMKELCSCEADAVERADCGAVEKLQAAQRDFLVEHLGAWSGLFAQRIGQAAVSAFYLLWAEFVHAFVQEDIEFLNDLLKPENLSDQGDLHTV